MHNRQARDGDYSDVSIVLGLSLADGRRTVRHGQVSLPTWQTVPSDYCCAWGRTGSLRKLMCSTSQS
jgi:hypothetical protein